MRANNRGKVLQVLNVTKMNNCIILTVRRKLYWQSSTLSLILKLRFKVISFAIVNPASGALHLIDV